MYPTRGSAKDANGNPISNVVTGSLIQAFGDGSKPVQPNGQVINMDVVGGSYSRDGVGNAVGQSIFARMRPDASGNKPAPTWAANYDIVIAANSGVVQAYGMEIDVNNNNADCDPGAGACQAVHLWFNGISGYSTTAFLYGGGYNTYQFNGKVTTNGATVSWSSGNQFNSAIKAVTIGGTRYRVNYISPTQLASFDALPTNATPVDYTARVQATHNGIFFNDFELVSDNDAWFNTAAYTGLRISGRHYIGVDTTGDEKIKYAFSSGQGQSTCLNNQDACWAYVGGGNLQYRSGGQLSFAVNGAANQANVDYVEVSQQPAGAGAVLRGATNFNLSSPLRLFGANGGGVQLNGRITMPSPSATNGSRKGAVCIDSSDNLYVATSGAC